MLYFNRLFFSLSFSLSIKSNKLLMDFTFLLLFL